MSTNMEAFAKIPIEKVNDYTDKDKNPGNKKRITDIENNSKSVMRPAQ